jgi:hypothetical protein
VIVLAVYCGREAGMTDEEASWVPRFASDPELFNRMISGGDLGARIEASGGDLREVLTATIIWHSLIGTAAAIAELQTLYRYCLKEGMPVHHRWQAFGYLSGAVKKHHDDQHRGLHAVHQRRP